jgi:chromosomal replication initiation ATPase DnaA
MSQIPLPLPTRTALGRADFLVSDSNAGALAWIDRWPDWPGGVLVLHGPAGCGKTHLAHIWRERSDAAIIPGADLTEVPPELRAGGLPAAVVDDAEDAPYVALLHLLNSSRERGVSLLIIARRPPGSWPVPLADLASRLRAAISVGIAPPDDALLGAVLVKHFADRQLPVAPEVIRYVLRRMERSFAAAAALAAGLDRLSLSRGGAVTIPLARRLLADNPGQSSLPPSDFGVA